MATEVSTPPPTDPRALDALIDSVCRELGVDRAAVCSGVRKRSESDARRIIAARARAELGLRAGVISDALGVSRQALWARFGCKS